jgi:hypothetical protein
MLIAEAQDLFGKLFHDAKSIYLRKLKASLSGAGLVQVDPTWDGTGLGPSQVVKLDRIEKSRTEMNNYEKYVKHAMPMAATQIGADHTQHLGGLVYSFAEDASIGFVEFDEFYRTSNARVIGNSLKDLIFNTCRFWYDHSERTRKACLYCITKHLILMSNI